MDATAGLERHAADLVNINLDGYRLREAIAWHVARANTHVAAAAQFDTEAMHMPVDLQTA